MRPQNALALLGELSLKATEGVFFIAEPEIIFSIIRPLLALRATSPALSGGRSLVESRTLTRSSPTNLLGGR